MELCKYVFNEYKIIIKRYAPIKNGDKIVFFNLHCLEKNVSKLFIISIFRRDFIFSFCCTNMLIMNIMLILYVNGYKGK